MKQRKVVVSVNLRPDQVEAVQETAARLGVPGSALMREGIDMVLRRYRDAEPLGAVDAARLGNGRSEAA